MIYLDYAATTPCDPTVFREIEPYFLQNFGNIHSLHDFGLRALEAVFEARNQIAKSINAEQNEVIFTSGATESSNISILRTIARKKCDFFTAKTQHASIIAIANKLSSEQVPVHYLKVDRSGILDLNYLEEQLSKYSGIVSICLINNETGTLQDLEAISKLVHNYGSLLHVDATQALGKIHLDTKASNIDFMSASGHKIYGPKGIGILYCKKENLKFLRIPRANPDIEFGIRPGTVPTPLCVGFAKALKICDKTMEDEHKKLQKLRTHLIDSFKNRLEEIYINGSENSFYPGIVNISFRGCEGEALMQESPRIAISSGSACTSNKLTISHVLAAMNTPPDIAQSSLRISLGRMTTKEDIDIAIEDLTKATLKLREMSAIWDMIKAGIDVNAVFDRGVFKK